MRRMKTPPSRLQPKACRSRTQFSDIARRTTVAFWEQLALLLSRTNIILND
jgi:hypothetical protein